MRLLITALALISTAHAMPDFKKSLGDIDVQTVKEKACPMVNGKKDCTATEVKDKALELKKKMFKE